jgi:hypothetical protein
MTHMADAAEEYTAALEPRDWNRMGRASVSAGTRLPGHAAQQQELSN